MKIGWQGLPLPHPSPVILQYQQKLRPNDPHSIRRMTNSLAESSAASWWFIANHDDTWLIIMIHDKALQNIAIRDGQEDWSWIFNIRDMDRSRTITGRAGVESGAARRFVHISGGETSRILLHGTAQARARARGEISWAWKINTPEIALITP